MLIDPYRPGVLEKLGLGPKVLSELNPRLVVARLSGWGQTGPWVAAPGHDINYLAMTGVLSTLTKSPNEPPYPPHNLLTDMAGGGLMCAQGILLALYERSKSGTGQVIDSSLLDGSIYVSSFLYHMQAMGMWLQPPGSNLLDTGAYFYQVYPCQDGKFVAVGCLEPKFYAEFVRKLGPYLTDGQKNELKKNSQYGNFASNRMKSMLKEVFLTKTRDKWIEIVFFT